MTLAEAKKDDLVLLPQHDWDEIRHLVMWTADGAVTTAVFVDGETSNERYTFPTDTACIKVGRHLPN